MSRLKSTSDVVCLFTERSLDRPWILYEAGVAKGTLNTPVLGIALGVPLSRVSTGPFYQFQNCDDSETDLGKLMHQLAKRVPTLELDEDVVKAQVAAFKAAEADILGRLATRPGRKIEEQPDEPIAKIVEEMKALPTRVAERLLEAGPPTRRRRWRTFHPAMLQELLHMSADPCDAVGILIGASMIRDELPWLYELAMEAYRAIDSGDARTIERQMTRIRGVRDRVMRGPIGLMLQESGLSGEQQQMLSLEFPHMLEQVLQRALQASLHGGSAPNAPQGSALNNAFGPRADRTRVPPPPWKVEGDHAGRH